MKVVNTIIFFAIYGLANANSLTQCESSDKACIDSNANLAYQKIINGIPELGIAPQEPLFQELIEGDLSTLKYKFFNSTFLGFKNCKLSNIKLDAPTNKLHFEYFCPKIEFHGKYEINGRLIVLPVEGKGDYKIVTGQYKLIAECDVQIVEGKDGKKHLNIKNFKLKPTALTAIDYKFNNLFNGQKDLSDAVHKFANENWKEVADLVQEPVWYAVIKREMAQANKYLKSISADEVIKA